MTIVTSAAELLVALSRAAGGEVIELAPGDYGDVTLDGLRFASTVMIRSQDALAPAIFDSLQVKNSSYITFDNISVRHVLDSGEPDWVSGFRIDKSDHIAVLDCEIFGSVDGNHTNDGQGLLVLDSSHIEILGTRFHDLKTGLSVGRSEFVEAIGNTFEDIRSDGAVFANVRHVVVEANTFANFHPALELGDHPDMIQVWNDGSFGDMYDIVIRNNVLMKGTGGDVQCIFVQGAIAGADQTTPSYAHDLIIEGNVIEGGAAQGIWVSHVEQTLIASNSLTQAADGQVAPSIRTDHTVGTTVTNNFAPRIEDFGSTALTSSGNTITGEVGSGSTVAGTDGGDTLNGTAANDIIPAAGGDDLVYGKDGSDSISGGEGKDRIYGDGGNDTLNGGAGKDELHGGDGNDGLFGGGGDDRLFGENGNDVLFGDGGHDMLNGGAGADELHGGVGNDGFFGGGGDDRLFGDSGVDTIYGDGGDDLIDGGTGDDVLRGGAGNDTFAFGIGCGSDTVADFQDGFDKLDFSRLPAIGSAANLEIESVSATVTLVRFFDGIEDVELTIAGTATIALDHADFLFGAA